MLDMPALNHPGWFALATFIMFAVVLGRYLLVAGLFYGIFYLWFPRKWQQRKLAHRHYPKSQFKKEITWSMVTALVFALTGAIGVLLWQNGWIKVYTTASDYPLWWLPLSFTILVLLHETWYYWLHRWMHHPRVFRYVHKVHHESKITSPWTAFSFHPIEGLLQAIFLPLALLVVPVHAYVLLFMLTIRTLSSVINHLEIEIYPRGFHRHILGKWLIGATHHSLHHKQFKTNYGLYFTFWDKWKNTESPEYAALFEAKTTPSKTGSS